MYNYVGGFDDEATEVYGQVHACYKQSQERATNEAAKPQQKANKKKRPPHTAVEEKQLRSQTNLLELRYDLEKGVNDATSADNFILDGDVDHAIELEMF